MTTHTQPKILDRNSKEYQNLKTATDFLNQKTSLHFTIENSYFDYGLNWLWTTIIVNNNKNTWQYLTPTEWSNIINTNDNTVLEKYIENLINQKQTV